MSEPAFHLTPMGKRYYEQTLPELIRQVEQLSEALRRLTEQLDASSSC